MTAAGAAGQLTPAGYNQTSPVTFRERFFSADGERKLQHDRQSPTYATTPTTMSTSDVIVFAFFSSHSPRI